MLSYSRVGELEGISTRWLSVVGPNARGNLTKLYEYILRRYELRAEEREEQKLSWNDLVEKEDRARFYSAGRVLMTVKGKHLLPVSTTPVGPWTIEQGVVCIGGVLWKQRRTETLKGFCHRTRRALEDRGFDVDFESLKPPVPQHDTNDQ